MDIKRWAHTAPDGTRRKDSRSKRLITSEMTPRELAKAVAEWHGWEGYKGYIYAPKSAAHSNTNGNARDRGYVVTPNDHSIASGWDYLALALTKLGIIEVGVGIHWKRQHEIYKEVTLGEAPHELEIQRVIANEVYRMNAGKRRRANVFVA